MASSPCDSCVHDLKRLFISDPRTALFVVALIPDCDRPADDCCHWRACFLGGSDFSLSVVLFFLGVVAGTCMSAASTISSLSLSHQPINSNMRSSRSSCRLYQNCNSSMAWICLDFEGSARLCPSGRHSVGMILPHLGMKYFHGIENFGSPQHFPFQQLDYFR